MIRSQRITCKQKSKKDARHNLLRCNGLRLSA
jgi:hypothetical protein